MDFGNSNLRSEAIVSDVPVIQLPLDEATLNTLLDRAIADANTKLAEKQIIERSDKNRRFWRGQHVDASRLDSSYQSPHVDNIVYQDEESRITLASARVPEITIAPPKDETQMIEKAKRLQRSIRNRIDNNTIKRLIKDGLRMHDLDLIAIVKCRWDANRGKNGDFVFELLDSRSVTFSATSRIVHDGYTAEHCDIIIHWLEEPTQLVLSKFPQKAEQLKALWGFDQIPSKLRYAEAHFTWYDQQGQLVEGVAWKYNQLILGSDRTPYFDYKGRPYINNESGQIELKFNNHFDRPRKPFMIFSYQNLLDWVYDTTTPFEQAIKINAIVNRRERQITEIADRTVPKLVFSSHAFKSGDAEKYVAKMNNPRDHILLTGQIDDIRKAVMIVQGNAPDRVLYEDVAALRGRIDSLFNTHGTTRGDVRSGESGIARQIAREGDLTITDDIVDFVVERIVFEMANWAIHMMKMYYHTPRPIKNLGRDGEVEFDEVSNDDIDDDIDVLVKVSATDPQLRRANATDAVNNKTTDPFSYMEDMDIPMPKERVKRLVSWMRGGQDLYKNYLDMLGIDDEMFDSAAQAQKDIGELMNGKSVQLSQLPDTAYVEKIAEFMQSPDFQNAEPQAQNALQQHVAKMKQMVNNQLQNGQQGNENNPGQDAGIPAAAGPQGQPTAPVA